MTPALKKFANAGDTQLTSEVSQRLDKNFHVLAERSGYQPLVVRNFVDVTSASVTYDLPNGSTSADKDYYFQKIDVTANTVTITAFGTQMINGSSTYVLAAQYDRVYLIWVAAIQQWLIQ